MTRYLFIVVFAMTFQNSPAQTLDKYIDQLYLGMLSQKPDHSISKFIETYVPVMLTKFDSNAKWTVYPLEMPKEPEFMTVTSSYVFYKHPYFNTNLKSGQLAITQKIYEDKKWINNISDIKLWFEFDNKADATLSFKQLIDTFSTFNVLKRISSSKGAEKAEFSDTSSIKYYSHIQIILVEDYSLGKKYATVTKKGLKFKTEPGYKILFEIGNDLY